MHLALLLAVASLTLGQGTLSAGAAAGGARDLAADVQTAIDWLSRTAAHVSDFNLELATFELALDVDCVPYFNDIYAKMFDLGVDPGAIAEHQAMYQTYMGEIRQYLSQSVAALEPQYNLPISTTLGHLQQAELNGALLAEDLVYLQAAHSVFEADFTVAVQEIDTRIENLFFQNWLLIQGTTGPIREAINADTDYLFSATTRHREFLRARMSMMTADTTRETQTLNVVISQLP